MLCNMSSTVDLPGAAHLVLAADVAYLEPETAAFTAMVDGWALQQRTRFLKPATISSRLTLGRRVAAFTNEYPWRWQAPDVEGFIDGCRNQAQPIVPSTGRLYEQTLRMFLDYATDPRYGWPATCLERFGVAPVQVLHEWNTVARVSEFEGQPGRRPLTYDEVQALFDAADGRVGRARSLGRKGALVAMRDAAVLKTVYAYGLRRREAWGLDVADLRHNPKVPRFGRFGGGVRAVG